MFLPELPRSIETMSGDRIAGPAVTDAGLHRTRPAGATA